MTLYYENGLFINQRQGTIEVCPQSFAYAAGAAGTDNQIIAAASGYITRVVGMTFQGNSGQCSFDVRDGTIAGTIKLTYLAVPPTTNQSEKLRFCEGGYFETTLGNGVNVSFGANSGIFSIQYVQYIP